MLEYQNGIKSLKSYLECEAILRKFFDKVNFCSNHCSYTKEYKDNLGCCTNFFDFYDCFEGEFNTEEIAALKRERKKMYGLPKKKNKVCKSPFRERCGYHSSKGCKLKTHKSPICISHARTGLKVYIREIYQVKYNENEIEEYFEELLVGKLKEEELEEFKVELNNLLAKLV